MYNCLREQSSAVHVCLRFWKGPEALTKSESFPHTLLYILLAAPAPAALLLFQKKSEKGIRPKKLSNHRTEEQIVFKQDFEREKSLLRSSALKIDY